MLVIPDSDEEDFVYDLIAEVKSWTKENKNNSNISDLEERFENILEGYREY